MLDRIRLNPAIVRTFVGAAAVVAAKFGLDLDAETVTAIATLVLIVVGVDVRRKVTPVDAPRLPKGLKVPRYDP